MTEPAGPATLSLLALAIAVAGPVFGPYALILFAACVGGLVGLSVHPASSRTAGVMYIVVAAMVALVVTGPAVWLIEKYMDIPARIALAPVAFVLGMKRDWLVNFVSQVVESMGTAITPVLTRGAQKGKGEGL